MARKRREPSGRRPKRRREPPSDTLPDPRAMEGIMQQMLGRLQGHEQADTPLDSAQALMYQAFEERDPRRRVQLAREALAISPDCADAYVELGDVAPARREALHLYQQGVAAGERALGPEALEQYAGHFWGVLETR